MSSLDKPVISSSNRYSFERELVADLCTYLEQEQTPWGEVSTICEFEFARGRVDVVAVDHNGQVLAFEAKLKKWRVALQQAYRNTCFAHRSYVIVPADTVRLVMRYSHEFERRSVGLCRVVDGEVEVLIEAEDQQPIQPWLSNRAQEAIQSR